MSDLEQICMCDCGESFIVESGWESKRNRNTLICTDCSQKEDDEIEREEEISNLLEGLDEAKSNVIFYTEELRKLGVKVEKV